MKLCHFEAGLDQPLFLIAGTCVIESEQMTLDTAGKLQEITSALNINFIYKSSFDKANRSSMSSFRGLGLEKGLEILEKVKQQIKVPVLTDVHEDTPLNEVAAIDIQFQAVRSEKYVSVQVDCLRGRGHLVHDATGACAQCSVLTNSLRSYECGDYENQFAHRYHLDK